MTLLDDCSPLARRFAAVLARTTPDRSKLPLEVYGAAFSEAEPSLATSPERRARLAAVLEELVEGGLLRSSRRSDMSQRPELPAFVTMLDRTRDTPVGREAAAYPWRPELAWAARLPMRRSEFDALRAIQAFLRERARSAPVVPVGERSLELFADEKRLDKLRQNRRLFAPGRLSLDLLRCRAFSPPFSYRRVGNGPVALVLENVATYRSVLAAVPPDTPVGVVVFGGGGNFAAAVGYFVELANEGSLTQVREIRYFGDLDRRGLEIPASAHALASTLGLPPVQPAVALWAMLLRLGKPVDDQAVPAGVADRLVGWLTPPLRDAARRTLVEGHRLAQEAVGTEALLRDPTWTSWAGLGPPGVLEQSARPIDIRTRSITGEDALIFDDRGTSDAPDTLAEASSWIAARDTRNWTLDDPLLDWLDRHGLEAGCVPDDARPGYDSRSDFRRFVMEKSAAFKAALVRLLATRADVLVVGDGAGKHAGSLQHSRETVRALRTGVSIVCDGVLRNPQRRTYGAIDLLVRSDRLAHWFPEALSWEEATTGAPGLGLQGFHYRPVSITLQASSVTSDGHLSDAIDHLPAATELWILIEALLRVQGLAVPGYILGRTWQRGEARGEGCLERLARVDLDHVLERRGLSLEGFASRALEWIQRLRREGSSWRVLPEPSVPELYPHARNTDDAPWRGVKRELALALCELTLLPGVDPEKRRRAQALGLRRWDDDGATAARLGVTGEDHARLTDSVVEANRLAVPALLPARIGRVDPSWRQPGRVEFFVDFETVSNLDDDFAALPHLGGQALIAQIGCGRWSDDGKWTFAQWTVEALTPAEERRVVREWLDHVSTVLRELGCAIEEARLCHWSTAEPASLTTAYNAARTRHPDMQWPERLPWFDVLDRVVRGEPVTVTGAFNFGLKSIARAMHAAGWLEVAWADGPADGLGAMVAIWRAAREAASAGSRLSLHPLMQEVARYNAIDCRAMAEVLRWLRRHR